MNKVIEVMFDAWYITCGLASKVGDKLHATPQGAWRADPTISNTDKGLIDLLGRVVAILIITLILGILFLIMIAIVHY